MSLEGVCLDDGTGVSWDVVWFWGGISGNSLISAMSAVTNLSIKSLFHGAVDGKRRILSMPDKTFLVHLL